VSQINSSFDLVNLRLKSQVQKCIVICWAIF